MRSSALAVLAAGALLLTSCSGGGDVTETEDTVISEALTVIDRSLAQLAARELVSSTEMSDLLLDLRLLLMASDPGPVDEPVGEGAPA